MELGSSQTLHFAFAYNEPFFELLYMAGEFMEIVYLMVSILLGPKTKRSDINASDPSKHFHVHLAESGVTCSANIQNDKCCYHGDNHKWQRGNIPF